MRFAKLVFLIAGIWGVVALAPLYFMEHMVGNLTPPAVNHPEYFYGFVGVALSFQIVFLTIATDPVHYRPIMIGGMLEKFTFVIAVVVLYALGRISWMVLGGAAGDALLGVLFVIAYVKTAPAARAASLGVP